MNRIMAYTSLAVLSLAACRPDWWAEMDKPPEVRQRETIEKVLQAVEDSQTIRANKTSLSPVQREQLLNNRDIILSHRETAIPMIVEQIAKADYWANTFWYRVLKDMDRLNEMPVKYILPIEFKWTVMDTVYHSWDEKDCREALKKLASAYRKHERLLDNTAYHCLISEFEDWKALPNEEKVAKITLRDMTYPLQAFSAVHFIEKNDEEIFLELLGDVKNKKIHTHPLILGKMAVLLSGGRVAQKIRFLLDRYDVNLRMAGYVAARHVFWDLEYPEKFDAQAAADLLGKIEANPESLAYGELLIANFEEKLNLLEEGRLSIGDEKQVVRILRDAFGITRTASLMQEWLSKDRKDLTPEKLATAFGAYGLLTTFRTPEDVARLSPGLTAGGPKPAQEKTATSE